MTTGQKRPYQQDDAEAAPVEEVSTATCRAGCANVPNQTCDDCSGVTGTAGREASSVAQGEPMVRPRRTLRTWWAKHRCRHHWTWCHPGDGRRPWSVCTFCGWRDDRR